jgi:hypothetical protein
MSAQVIDFPPPVRLAHATTDTRLQENPSANKVDSFRIPAALLYRILCSPPPTEEEVRRESFLLECD